MVPTEAFDDRPKGHTRRDLAGFFNLSATAVKHPSGQGVARLDPAIVENARGIIMKTVFHWGVASDAPLNKQITKAFRRSQLTTNWPEILNGSLCEPRV